MFAVESQRAVFKNETIAVSDTISISMQKQHSRILPLLRGRMREMHWEPQVREASPSGKMFGLPWHLPECLFHKSESGRWFGEKCSYADRQVEEQPSKRSQKNGDKSSVAMLTTIGLRILEYGAAEVFIDFAEELRHTETDPMCKIHESRCTSRWHSRPKSFARTDLPRWTSSP